MIDRIQWLGHSSYLLQGPPLIYIDPCGITRGAFLADVILISQTNYDHFSPADISKLVGPNTTIIGNAEVAEALGEFPVQVLRPWQSVSLGRTRITAVPGGRSASSQLRELGFLVSLAFYDIYYAGEHVPVAELRHLRPDIAILPIGNRRSGLTNVDETVEVVKKLTPRWVIPNHRNAGGMAGAFLDIRALDTALGDLTDVVVPGQVARTG